MSLYQRYELIEPLPGEGIWSFRARDTASGAWVTVHLLVGLPKPEYEIVLQRLAHLRKSDPALLAMGMEGRTPYVVTAAPPFQDLATWVREHYWAQPAQAAGPPAAASGPGEYTRMLGTPARETSAPMAGATGVFSSPAPAPAPPQVQAPQMQAPQAAPPEVPPPKRGWFRNLWSRLPRPAETRPIDQVHITVMAPATFVPGHAHEIRFWAHLEEQAPGVIERALAAFGTLDPRRVLRRSEGPFEVARDTTLHLSLSVDGMTVQDDHKAIRWTGAIGSAAFVIKVPDGCATGSRAASASVRVQGAELARIDFVVSVGKARAGTRPLPARVMRHRTAFASYASEDREAVLARIQGIQKAAPHMQVFVDVMKLRSGEDWERKLLEVIPRVDVFYLFWCWHAKESPWVEREWRCAYKAKGLDFIDPVPLEPAAGAPPPAELARKHFNDPILAYCDDPAHRHTAG